MLRTLSDFLLTLEAPYGVTRTLPDPEPVRDAAGRLVYAVGNSAAVFRVRIGGRDCALRCYLRPLPDDGRLEACWPGRVFRRELFLFTNGGGWADVVLDDWIEGRTLQQCVAEAVAAGDCRRLSELSREFDRLALELLAAPWAHGDLKPDNIIVTPAGRMELIDFDTRFTPELAGRPAAGLGTAAFQHPRRTAADFNIHIDDFPVALLSTALRMLALDPAFGAGDPEPDGLLLNGCRMADAAYPLYEAAVERLAREGLGARHAIARLLRHPLPELPELEELLRHAVAAESGTAAPEPSADSPELFAAGGRWGFRNGAGEVTIPPVYDNAFDFSDGVAAVTLGGFCHYIGPDGRLRMNCAGCRAIKPARGGRARLLQEDAWVEVPLPELDI